jgi:hypothetical protein
MSILTDLNVLGQSLHADVKEKKGAITLEILVAERKAFLSKKRLTYIVKCRPDDAAKELNFSEMLKESGSGLSSGSDNMSPGFGFKVTTSKTGFGAPAQGTIQEQSALFGQQYTYSFDWTTVRNQIGEIAAKNGYTLKYHLVML